MGEESMIRPPAAKKARITWVHSPRSSRSSPTLNVIHVPNPITGSCSPDEGIGREIGPSCADNEKGRSKEDAAPAATAPSSCRRLSRGSATERPRHQNAG